MWRPENWKNPYEDIFTLRDAGNDEIAMEKPCMEYKAYEAGADAYGEALLDGDNFVVASETALVMPGFLTDLNDYLRSLGNGRWVFIPDDTLNDMEVRNEY